MNARSVVNKVQPLENLLLLHEPDIVAITETWLSSDILDHEFTPPSYSVIRKDRLSRGGGVALLIRRSISYTLLPDVPDTEAVFCKILCNSTSIVAGCVYRSPSSGSKCIVSIHNFLQQHVHSSAVVIMGDFNLADINWSTMHHTSQGSEDLFDLMLNFNLHQIVSCPTRVQGTASSVLDLILISSHLSHVDTQVDVVEGISDHRVPVCRLIFDHRLHLQSTVNHVPDFSKADDASVLTYLAHEFYEFVELNCDPATTVNDLWLRFKHIVLHCMNEFIPLRRTRPQRHNPWITREILHAKRKVKRLRKAVKKQCCSANTSKLKTAISHFKAKTKQAKQHYFEVTLPSFITGNPQRFWKHFSRRKNSSPELSLQQKTAKSNMYNNYFHSVFTKDDGKIPQLAHMNNIGISPIDVVDEGIFSLLLDLDPKKSSGPDDIPNPFLKRYAEWCSKYLGMVFRKSLAVAKLPDDWKKAKIVPIPKAGNSDNPSNFRPISLTSTSCKILEHIILKHLTVLLESNGVLSSCQHGFRSGLSTTTQLTEVVHDLALSINNCTQTDIILLDFAKAFDSVCHNKLIAKLRSIIGDGILTSWVKDFLTNRSQYVLYDQVPSENLPVTSGVPQGSVLGPLLFLVFINDITDSISCTIRLFADDCIIYREINSHSDHLALSDSLHHLSNWCDMWQMSINPKKTVCMTITRKKEAIQYDYRIKGTRLEKVNAHKYLGVTITSSLRWDTHISNITSVALRKLFYLRRCLRLAPHSTKLLAYTTYVRPVLEYANTVWFPYTVTNIQKLENVQRKAARFICNKYKRTDSPTNMLASSGLQTLAIRAKQARLKFLFQLLHNHYKIDPSLYIRPSDSRVIRHKHSYTLKEYSYRNDTFKHSFFPLAIREWNCLDSSITSAKSVSDFALKLENMFS